ncbi:hypothetical protein FACS1894102_3270 [Spirochaetia bacterium]|nr:hypothetical protein FACS1894102_3270 [Spirochaetia bacterium]
MKEKTDLSRTEIFIKIGAVPTDKEDAIMQACKILFEAGCVEDNYAQSMFNREKTANTFLGSGLAIPHGCLEDKGMVKRDALSIIQAPAGVAWGAGQTAKLIVAIAAAGGGHINVLRRLAGLIADEALMDHLSQTTNAAEIIKTSFSLQPSFKSETKLRGSAHSCS